jgi:predicted nucleic-acid-binding Zn-ribbon protein
MNAWKTVELMRKYSRCPKCGNEYVGNGEGTLDVSDDTFIRTCKCGWKVEIKQKES